MSKTVFPLDNTNDGVDFRWILVLMAIVLGAIAVVLAWPTPHATASGQAVAAVVHASVTAPPPAAVQAVTLQPKLSDSAAAPQSDPEPQEDNHAATF